MIVEKTYRAEGAGVCVWVKFFSRAFEDTTPISDERDGQLKCFVYIDNARIDKYIKTVDEAEQVVAFIKRCECELLRREKDFEQKEQEYALKNEQIKALLEGIAFIEKKED